MTTDTRLTVEEVSDLFGGEAGPIEVNDDELTVAFALREIRDLLMCAAESEGVGVNQLAARLGISPSVVSRMLRSEGDMRVSTAVLWARALGRVWNFSLSKMNSGHGKPNSRQKWETLVEPPSIPAASAAPRPTVRNISSKPFESASISIRALA